MTFILLDNCGKFTHECKQLVQGRWEIMRFQLSNHGISYVINATVTVTFNDQATFFFIMQMESKRSAAGNSLFLHNISRLFILVIQQLKKKQMIKSNDNLENN